MKDYRDLLSITPQVPVEHKNKIEIWMEWESNDANYIEKTEWIEPEKLFGNKKLIYCLAYIKLDPDFKNGEWGKDAVFCQYVSENKDINDLLKILTDNNFIFYSECKLCHTCTGLQISYVNENGCFFDVEFEDIHERWKGMTYEEICKEINEIEEKEE